jgi:methyl-accepting chemotaxis protein
MSKSVLDIIIGLKDQASQKLGVIAGSLENMAHRAKKALTGLAIGAVAGLTTAFWQLTKSVKAFAQQELGEVDVKSALTQMGQYTEEYMDKLKNLSNQYQKTTNIGDEMWLKTFAQLTRFGMHADNVDKVAEATKNLAGLMDGNLQGAMLAMQRALEGEFSMFSRYGIKLDLTGDKVKDLDNLMTSLAEKGGGLLEARAETLSGKFTGLKNAITDFREEVGRTVTEATGLKDGLDFLREKFNELEESAKNGKLNEILKKAGEAVQNWARQIAAIVDQINSVEDLKVVATTIGDWMKEKLIEGGHRIAAFLLEKSPAIGDAIGAAIKNSLLGFFKGQIREGTAEQMASQSMYGKDSPGLFTKAAWGLDPDYTQKVQFYLKALKADDLQQAGRTAAAQIEISDNSQQSLADRITNALTARQSDSSRNDSERLLAALENGLNGEALDRLVTGLELTAEDLELLAAYTTTFTAQTADVAEKANQAVESATKVQEETTKSLSAVQDSHTSLQATLRSTQTASQSTTQVARQTQQVVDMSIGQMAMMAARIQQQQAELNAIAMQLRSMRA